MVVLGLGSQVLVNITAKRQYCYQVYQPYNERATSTSRRRLSSPIINPNFEDDFDATLTTTINTDDVLASLSGVTLTSSAGNGELKDIGHTEFPINHGDSLKREAATRISYKEHEEVVPKRLSASLILLLIVRFSSADYSLAELII